MRAVSPAIFLPPPPADAETSISRRNLASFARFPIVISPERFRTTLRKGSLSLSPIASLSSSAGGNSNDAGKPSSSSRTYKRSVLSNLVQEIEPLDVSLIQKDVPSNTIDAMKRTISGMLGLLPSDQFDISVDAFWEPLSRLLHSSMITGYTLRNAEYQLCLRRNLHLSETLSGTKDLEDNEIDSHDSMGSETPKIFSFRGGSSLFPKSEVPEEDPSLEELSNLGLGDIAPEAQDYILHLQSRLSSAKSELLDAKQKNAAIQMQRYVCEEKNDLLDYLRSLDPEEVIELSAPTIEMQEAIHSVVHGLLATLSPKIRSKVTKKSESATPATLKSKTEDCQEKLENASVQFQPLISVTRDYLARLLFWCMLLGHHLRGLEYRLELAQLLQVPSDEVPN